MLRRSWGIVLEMTVSHPELVPTDSLASSVATKLWSDEPWLIWESTPDWDHARYDEVLQELLMAGLPHVGETLGRIGERLATQADQPTRTTEANRLQRGFGTVLSVLGSVLRGVSTPSAPRDVLNEDTVKVLVERLGLPRTTVEALVERLRAAAT
jgi:hypothetical protein